VTGAQYTSGLDAAISLGMAVLAFAKIRRSIAIAVLDGASFNDLNRRRLL
jgi:hypothetical protein